MGVTAAFLGKKQPFLMERFQGKKIVDNAKLQDFVKEKLYDDQSPAN